MVFDALTWFGLAAVTLALIFYALERKGRIYIFGFGVANLLCAAYGFLQGAWPFGIIEIFYGVAAFYKFWTTKGG
ncbi:hypothetical protein IT570_07375 [Candidatus Sumerlaeota bacterium]|nr:hypothetical protein [Candidatus Sumerlaeota bacterium]